MLYGVLCKRADGDWMIVEVEAPDARNAQEQVEAHRRLFYGSGDAAGRWLASRNPGTLVEVGEVKPLADWDDSESQLSR